MLTTPLRTKPRIRLRLQIGIACISSLRRHAKSLFVPCVIGAGVVAASSSLAQSSDNAIPIPDRFNQPWGMDNGNAARTGQSAFAGPSVGVLDWKRKVGGAVPGIACDRAGRAILGATFYTEWWSNELYVQCYGQGGQIEWRRKVTPYVWGGSQGVKSGPALDRYGNALLNSGFGQIVRFDGSGNLQLTVQRMSNSTNDSSPAWNLDGTFVHQQAGTVAKYAWDGSVLWTATAFSQTDVAVAPNGDVAMGGVRTSEPHGAPDVYYFNANGTLRWSRNSTNGTRTQVCFGPDGTLYTTVGGVTAYNPNGTVRWNQPGGGWGVCLDGLGRALVPSGQTIRAFDRKTGAPVWTTTLPTSGSIVEGLTIDSASRIFVSTTDGYVYGLGTAGQILWSLQVADVCRSQPAIGANRSLFVSGTTGFSDHALVRIKQG